MEHQGEEGAVPNIVKLAKLDLSIKRAHESGIGFRPTATGVVVCGQKSVLFVRSAKSGDWSLPKGGIKKGEDPYIALLREVEEEVGLCSEHFADIVYVGSARDKLRNSKQREGFTRGKNFHCYAMKLKPRGEDCISIDQTEVSEHQFISCHQQFWQLKMPMRRREIYYSALYEAGLPWVHKPL